MYRAHRRWQSCIAFPGTSRTSLLCAAQVPGALFTSGVCCIHFSRGPAVAGKHQSEGGNFIARWWKLSSGASWPLAMSWQLWHLKKPAAEKLGTCREEFYLHGQTCNATGSEQWNSRWPAKSTGKNDKVINCMIMCIMNNREKKSLSSKLKFYDRECGQLVRKGILPNKAKWLSFRGGLRAPAGGNVSMDERSLQQPQHEPYNLHSSYLTIDRRLF